MGDFLQTPRVSALRCVLQPACHVANEAETRLKCGECFKAHKRRMHNAPTPAGRPESPSGCGRQSLAGSDVAGAGEQRPRAAPTRVLVGRGPGALPTPRGFFQELIGRPRSWAWGRGGQGWLVSYKTELPSCVSLCSSRGGMETVASPQKELEGGCSYVGSQYAPFGMGPVRSASLALSP